MARVNVYLPDELAAAARAAHLNVSSLTQDALRRALAASKVDVWLEGLKSVDPVDVERSIVSGAVAAAKDEVSGL